MKDTDARLGVARESARLICEQGINDYRLAKDKAMQRLGLERGPAPSNREIADCVADHLEIFEGDVWRERLVRMRTLARHATRLCAPFKPRLTGAVVSGLATRRSRVQLHLFAEFDEAVDLFLADQAIPYETGEKRLRHPDGREIRRPTCVFMAENVTIELVIFAEDDIRWSPQSPVDGKPMPRLTPDEFEASFAAADDPVV